MDAEREREIRDLAARLSASKRHRKISVVLGDLLAEIDLLRGDDEPTMSMGDALAIIEAWAASGVLEGRDHHRGVGAWREAALAKAYLYPEGTSS